MVVQTTCRRRRARAPLPSGIVVDRPLRELTQRLPERGDGVLGCIRNFIIGVYEYTSKWVKEYMSKGV